MTAAELKAVVQQQYQMWREISDIHSMGEPYCMDWTLESLGIEIWEPLGTTVSRFVHMRGFVMACLTPREGLGVARGSFYFFDPNFTLEAPEGWVHKGHWISDGDNWTPVNMPEPIKSDPVLDKDKDDPEPAPLPKWEPGKPKGKRVLKPQVTRPDAEPTAKQLETLKSLHEQMNILPLLRMRDEIQMTATGDMFNGDDYGLCNRGEASVMLNAMVKAVNVHKKDCSLAKYEALMDAILDEAHARTENFKKLLDSQNAAV